MYCDACIEHTFYTVSRYKYICIFIGGNLVWEASSWLCTHELTSLSEVIHRLFVQGTAGMARMYKEW